MLGLALLFIGHLFNGAGKTRFSFYSTLINFVVFLPLAFVLTQSYSVLGLLIAILISTTCSFAYSLWAVIKKIQIKFDFKLSSRIYLASILSSIPTLLLSLYVQFYCRFLNLIFYVSVFVFISI